MFTMSTFFFVDIYTCFYTAACYIFFMIDNFNRDLLLNILIKLFRTFITHCLSYLLFL